MFLSLGGTGISKRWLTRCVRISSLCDCLHGPSIQLQKVHPDEQIPPPPAKDRTAVVSSPVTPPPISPYDNDSSSEHYSSEAQHPNSRLEREKNRLTLRSYLYTLLSSSNVASSPVLKSFLLSGPIIPTYEELADMRKREEADKVREEGRRKFAKEISNRVTGLRDAIKNVKGDLMGKGRRILCSF